MGETYLGFPLLVPSRRGAARSKNLFEGHRGGIARLSIGSKLSRELALMAKRRGDHAEAAQLWRTLLTGSQHAIEACEQTGASISSGEKRISRKRSNTLNWD